MSDSDNNYQNCGTEHARTSLTVLPIPCVHSRWPVACAVYNPFGEEERQLFTFGSSADLQRWNVFSDSQYGGHSAAALKLSTEHKVCWWPLSTNHTSS